MNDILRFYAPTNNPLIEDVFPTVEEVYQEFADALQTPFVIAGGAVRDELLGRRPKDYDLFLFGPYDRRRLDRYTKGPPQKGYRAFQLVNLVWRTAAIQVVSDRGDRTVDRLLDTFDWSICLFAFDGNVLHCREDVSNIGPGQSLWLNSDSTAQASIRRGYSFAARYEMVLDPDDMEHLRAKAALDAQWRERWAA